jgi:hypothetical protein
MIAYPVDGSDYFLFADQPLAIVSHCYRTADFAISTGREEVGFFLCQ